MACILGWFRPQRQVDEPEGEKVVRGPRDGFVESLWSNVGLLRQKIKNPNLKLEVITLGTLTLTEVGIVYVEGIVNPKIVEEVRRRVKRINVDRILAANYVYEFIDDSPWSPFPTAQITERPDRLAYNLLDGRIGVITDGTPIALVVPTVFWDFLKSPEDYIENLYFATFIRFIRLVAHLSTLVLPGAYVALTTIHLQMLPESMSVLIAGARLRSPLPIALEMLLMEIMIEVLREAGVRMPGVFGQTLSVVGALVIGEAAVTAGFIEPMIVVVVAFSALASFVIPGYNAVVSIRLLRFPLILLSAALGFFGLTTGLMFYLFHLVSLRSFGVPYFAPLAPWFPKDLGDIFGRLPWWKNFRRPTITGVLLITALAEKFPGQSISQYAQTLLGTWLGKAVGIFYGVTSLYVGAISAVRSFTQIFEVAVMPETPLWVFVAVLTALGIYAAWQGIEPVARANDLVLPFTLLVLLVLLLLALPRAEVYRGLPILQFDLPPIFQGMLVPLGYLGEIYFILILAPVLNRPEELRSASLKALLFSTLALTLTIQAILFVLGTYRASAYLFPLRIITEMMLILGFFEHFEPLLLSAWLSWIGLDTAPGGRVRVTAAITPPLSPVPTGAAPPEKLLLVSSATGDTLFEAVRNINSHLPKRLFWNYLHAVIISENMARSGVEQHLDALYRNFRGRRNAWVFITRGPTDPIFKIDPQIEKVPSKLIDSLAQTEQTFDGKSRVVRLTDFQTELADPGFDPVVSVLRIWDTEEKQLLPTGDKVPKKGELDLDGSAVFRGDKLVGWFSPKESQTYLLARGEFKTGLIVIPNPEKPPNRTGIEIIRSKRKLSAKLVDGQVTAKIQITIKGQLGDRWLKVPDSEPGDPRGNPEFYTKMGQQLESKIKADVEELLDKAQTEFNADILGIGDYLRNRSPNDWEQVRSQWWDYYKQTSIEVEVKAKITAPNVMIPVNPREDQAEQGSPDSAGE